MSDTRPIGVFDSGLGGLTVVRELFRLMPGERIVYLGDTARCPYGGRSEETIRTFGLQDAQLLMDMDIKLLVAACNTVSSVALDHIEKNVKEIPVVGVVLPGARAAAQRTVERKVGVIGTAATIRAGAYTRAIQSLNPLITVFGKACPLFVPLVEEGLIDHEITRLTVQHYLKEFLEKRIDCVILGCTHYPLLFQTIQEFVGTPIHLVDSALWTAKEVQNILMALGALSSERSGGLGGSSFLVTDYAARFRELAAAFLGADLPSIELVELEKLTKLCATAAVQQ
jgi:glutamate racemase